MRFRRLASFATLILLPALPAASGRPMRLEDLLTAVRVGDPRLSPDGKWVAFVRTATDPGTLKRNEDIFFTGTWTMVKKKDGE